MERAGVIALLAFMLCGTAGFLSSCSSESPAYNRENIKATWIVDTYDGQPLDERNYTVMTFTSSSTVSYAGVLTRGDGNYQWGENTLTYSIYCCDLSISGTYSGLFGFYPEMETAQEYYFVESADSSMTLGLESWTLGGAAAEPEFSQMTMRKISSDYASADSTLLGVWQFSSRNGEPFQDYRLHFQSDGVLTMSVRAGENAWTAMGDSTDYYRIYEDFLTLTLYNNDVFGTPSKWNVKCFRIDSLSSETATMAVQSSGETFTLSHLSSN